VISATATKEKLIVSALQSAEMTLRNLLKVSSNVVTALIIQLNGAPREVGPGAFFSTKPAMVVIYTWKISIQSSERIKHLPKYVSPRR
jgi:hypothetical protein